MTYYEEDWWERFDRTPAADLIETTNVQATAALRRAVSHIRRSIESMERTIAACKDQYPDRAAHWQAEIDDLKLAIAVLERS